MDRVKLQPAVSRSSRVKLKPRLAVAWAGVFEKWSRQWVRRNHWRVKSMMPTEDDALQECALIFCKCLDRYATTVDNPAWFMALYKTSVTRAWATFAIKDGGHRETFVDSRHLAVTDGQLCAVGDEDTVIVAPAEQGAGPLAVALSEVSQECRDVLGMLADAPADVVEYLFGAGTESANSRIRRWFRLPKGAAVATEMRSLFFL